MKEICIQSIKEYSSKTLNERSEEIQEEIENEARMNLFESFEKMLVF